MSKLTCTGLRKSFSKKEALKGLDLTVESGKIYGLIGKNGAGKTTLLGILSGQNPATSGTVLFDDKKVWENQSVVDKMCFSREISATAYGFMADSRKAKYLFKAASYLFPYWDTAYADTLKKEFGIDVKKRISQMSKGMLSAISITIGLASKAPFTFLDEPVAGLDVFMREKFYHLLIEEFSNTGRSFVISTHLIDEAARAFEEVIILDDGVIVKSSNTEELLAKHRIISGKDDQIDDFAKTYKVIHSESMGRTKSVCIEIDDMERFKADAAQYDIDVAPASLQKLFTQLV